MDTAITAMKDAIKKTYLVKAGQKVVDMNCAAVDEGVSALHEDVYKRQMLNMDMLTHQPESLT